MPRRTTLAALAALALAAAGCSPSASSAPPAAPPTTAGGPHPATPAQAPATSPAPLRRLIAGTASWRLPGPLSRMVVVASGGGLVVAGGLTDAGSQASVLRWTPGTGLTAAGRLAQGVHDSAGALLAGHVLVFAGGARSETAAVQRLRPSATARVIGTLPGPRSDLSVATVGGTAYVVGGYDGRRELADVLATTDGTRFRVVARLPVTVRYAGVVAVGHTVWVLGGDHHRLPTDVVQRIDVTTGHASVAGRLPHPWSHEAAVVLAGTVVLAGGVTDHGVTGEVATFDPSSLAVRAVATLPVPVSDAGAAVAGGTAYLVGGERPARTAVVQTLKMGS